LSYGPDYYARSADELGWGAGHRPDAFKLEVLRRHVVGARIADVACGPGVYAAALAGDGRQIVGVDFSAALLKQGRRPGWLPVAASGMSLPLRDGWADTTCLLSVLEHVDDAALLREATRVTSRRLVIQVPLEEPRLLAESGLLFSHWSDRSHLRTYSRPSLEQLLSNAGWRMAEFIPAYPRDLQEAFVRGIEAPEVVRNAVRALLKPLRGLSPRPAAEAFVVAEPR